MAVCDACLEVLALLEGDSNIPGPTGVEPLNGLQSLDNDQLARLPQLGSIPP